MDISLDSTIDSYDQTVTLQYSVGERTSVQTINQQQLAPIATSHELDASCTSPLPSQPHTPPDSQLQDASILSHSP